MRAALAALALALTGAQAEPVNLHYIRRPPYMVPGANGGVTGLTADIAAAAFTAAKIPYVWVETPFLRQMAILRENAGRDCLVGTYRLPERERFARYTRAIYRDGAIVALVSRKTATLAATDRLNRLLTHPELRLLVKDGYSYGGDMDQRLRQFKPRVYSVAQESGYMLRMVLSGQGLYLLAAEEEARALIAHEGLPPAQFQLIALRDAPRAELRHIACSKRVSGAEIGALDAAIASLPGLSPP